MKKVSLLFGIHMHQPVDNFDKAVEKAVKLSYAPFFATMKKYPDFKFSLHCSGWLLEKIRLEYPELFQNMQYLTNTGSIEWLSGGYYEPVLSAIPSKDRRAQIKKLSRYIQKYFGQTPHGLWLAERVWESSLVGDLQACKIEYAMVDDYHFLSNGYDEMNGYYTTEDNAKELKLFPIAKSLRYALPFSQVEDSIASIVKYSHEDNASAIFFDDAEKFGLWPQTNKWVYKEKWLEKFVQAVLDHKQISTQHYSNYVATSKSLGLAYLDNCSYFEMAQWSLPPKEAETFEKLREHHPLLKGGIWKNFFIKYHESNYLHKRMLSLSLKQKSFSKDALEALYKLQTNDTFWHGVFGGFYLPSLRDNAYKYLLAIEKQQHKKGLEFTVLDINKDGFDDLKVLTDDYSAIISTKNGAQLIEFGSLDTLFNWQNTIMRREELYHKKILHPQVQNQEIKSNTVQTIHERAVPVDNNLRTELIYDWHEKNSFIEHFSLEPFTLENFKTLTFREIGDFANKSFTLKNKKFIRKGNLYLNAGVYPSKLKKQYSFLKNKIVLQNKFKSAYTKKIYFAEEFNLHFAHPKKVTLNEKYVQDGFCELNCNTLRIADDFTHKSIIIKTNQKCTIYAFVLHTVSQSEQGFERIAQQISFIFTTSFSVKLALEFSIEVIDV